MNTKECSSRIVDEFIELTQIDAVSYRERKIADVLKEKLIQLGFEVQEDQAGAAYGSSTGNLYGFLKGSLPGGAILLCAHMDTVEPGLGKRPVFHEDGRITSSGDTILGADDVCGLVEILEAVRFLKENNVRYDHIIFNAGEGERIMINDMKPDGLVTAYAVNTVRDRFCRTEFVTDNTMGTRFD